MHIRTLNLDEFNEFQSRHLLSNLYQTVNYGVLKAEDGYEYELIGLCDEEENVLAASLILTKPIGVGCIYGYAPRGFLIDYEDEYLLRTFTKLLKEYYLKKNCVFIKVNPNIVVGKYDKEKNTIIYNKFENIKNELISLGYKKLKDNLYFESMLPRYNAIINLKEYSSNTLSKNTKNKIKKRY